MNFLSIVRDIALIIALCIFIALCILAVSGCTALLPDAGRVYGEHVSHPQAGPPFGSPREEDSLDTVNASLVWREGAWFVETGLGWQLADGGFYGPDLIFSARVGREFTWSKP